MYTGSSRLFSLDYTRVHNPESWTNILGELDDTQWIVRLGEDFAYELSDSSCCHYWILDRSLTLIIQEYSHQMCSGQVPKKGPPVQIFNQEDFCLLLVHIKFVTPDTQVARIEYLTPIISK